MTYEQHVTARLTTPTRHKHSMTTMTDELGVPNFNIGEIVANRVSNNDPLELTMRDIPARSARHALY